MASTQKFCVDVCGSSAHNYHSAKNVLGCLRKARHRMTRSVCAGPAPRGALPPPRSLKAPLAAKMNNCKGAGRMGRKPRSTKVHERRHVGESAEMRRSHAPGLLRRRCVHRSSDVIKLRVTVRREREGKRGAKKGTWAAWQMSQKFLCPVLFCDCVRAWPCAWACVVVCMCVRLCVCVSLCVSLSSSLSLSLSLSVRISPLSVCGHDISNVSTLNENCTCLILYSAP